MNILHQQVVKELIVWIEGHVTCHISVDDIAKISGYSKWHLQRIFREETGMSIAEFVRKWKIQRAANILRTGDESILSVALNFGFENQQSFTRVFSACYGIPPARWRSLHRKP
ncbi:helix-turn-helix transcriptional regulator [Pantoea piersonii]|jgi:AraC-like DNA-binding protein|uniref:helix-turn-helix transcriptional regulator n=1 Tax=Pantoea piersonii TaxID=2364647 RepID=UPI000EA40113|nr:AraC family transcriptional regulator [Pantoea piersonii]MDU6441311.1 AraC family transcriptional regulator [Pantoea sp.]MBZ6385921.1 AraC family transcriptional regulator [Pantoea piersonii]MBZ6399482.1 AraC family transcriptional regulator [Pantoea piersonii]MBZ6407995.1 AraC family transcriptional regulator [Pantoea piersonii]MBZ6427263.1 AraC family transcriptional regulator [Pantoea piersonii]